MAAPPSTLLEEAAAADEQADDGRDATLVWQRLRPGSGCSFARCHGGYGRDDGLEETSEADLRTIARDEHVGVGREEPCD